MHISPKYGYILEHPPISRAAEQKTQPTHNLQGHNVNDTTFRLYSSLIHKFLNDNNALQPRSQMFNFIIVTLHICVSQEPVNTTLLCNAQAATSLHTSICFSHLYFETHKVSNYYSRFLNFHNLL